MPKSIKKTKKSKKSKKIQTPKKPEISENDPKIEKLIKKHINQVNSKWQSNVFTSASITKIIMKELDVSTTRFRLIHKEVRKILLDWANQRLCVHMGTTHYTHSSKTKMIMEFPDEMIDFFRFEGFVAFPI